jgi:hypothetical protein
VPDSSDHFNDLFEPVPPSENSIHELELDPQTVSAISLVHQAEYMYSHQHHEEAYRLARQAYSIDPYDLRGNLIYVATMVDLGLKNELFYLGQYNNQTPAHAPPSPHLPQVMSWFIRIPN